MKILIGLLLRFVLTITLIQSPLISSVNAEMISTADALSNMSRVETETNVTHFLGREDVKNQFIKLGISPEEASSRLASLSDTELNSIAMEIEQNKAGGAVYGILSVVLIVILIIYFAKRI